MTNDTLSFGIIDDPRSERARRRYLAQRLSDLRALEELGELGETSNRIDAVLADTTPLTPSRLLVALADVEEALASCFYAMRVRATTELAVDLTVAGAVSWARSSLYPALAERSGDELASVLLLLEESGALEALPGSLMREDLVAEPAEVLRVAASLRKTSRRFAVAREDARGLVALVEELELRRHDLSLSDYFSCVARAQAELLRVGAHAYLIVEHGEGRLLLSLAVDDVAARFVATNLLPGVFAPDASPTPRVLN